MNFALVRHAIAEDREVFSETGLSDDLRPLIDKGRTKMFSNGRGLKLVLPRVDIIVTSPFKRAHQTAEILNELYPDADFKVEKCLSPGGHLKSVLQMIKTYKDKTPVFVGHEPDLSALAGYLLSGSSSGLWHFKKGGFALLNFPEAIQAGSAKLECLLRPWQIKALSKGD